MTDDGQTPPPPAAHFFKHDMHGERPADTLRAAFIRLPGYIGDIPTCWVRFDRRWLAVGAL